MTLAVDRGTATDAVPDYERVTVTLESDATSEADHPEDYQLTSYSVAFPAGNGVTTGTTTLEAQPDEDVGDEVVVLKATVSGEATYGSETEEMTLSPITLVDGTIKKIYPESIEDIDNAVMDASSTTVAVKSTETAFPGRCGGSGADGDSWKSRATRSPRIADDGETIRLEVITFRRAVSRFRPLCRGPGPAGRLLFRTR